MSTPRALDRTGLTPAADYMALRAALLTRTPVLAPGQVGFSGAAGTVARAGNSWMPTKPHRVVSRQTPFKLTGVIEGGAAYIKVRPGLIDDSVPTISGVGLTTLPAPKIAVSGAAGVLWLKCTLDSAGVITNIIVETGSSIPANTSTSAYRFLGSFTSASGVFTSVYSALNTNQTHRRCNGFSTWGSA